MCIQGRMEKNVKNETPIPKDIAEWAKKHHKEEKKHHAKFLQCLIIINQ
jgi:hypothetical protein